MVECEFTEIQDTKNQNQKDKKGDSYSRSQKILQALHDKDHRGDSNNEEQQDRE